MGLPVWSAPSGANLLVQGKLGPLSSQLQRALHTVTSSLGAAGNLLPRITVDLMLLL